MTLSTTILSPRNRPLAGRLAAVAASIALVGACAAGPGPSIPYWLFVATARDSTGAVAATCTLSISGLFGHQANGTGWSGLVSLGFERRISQPDGATNRDTVAGRAEYPVEVTRTGSTVRVVLRDAPFRDTLTGRVLNEERIEGDWVCDARYPHKMQNPPSISGLWQVGRLSTID